MLFYYRNMNKVSCSCQHNKESVNVNCFSYIVLAFRNTNSLMFSTNRCSFNLANATDALYAATHRERPECSVTCGTEAVGLERCYLITDCCIAALYRCC